MDIKSIDLLDTKVRESIESNSIDCEVIGCDDKFADTAAFCEKYGYDPSQAANTILVAVKTNPVTIVACVVLATTKLDVNKKLRAFIDNKRASFASGEQTTELTGMKIGGVVIFGLPVDVPVFADEAVMRQSEVVMGGGNRTSKLLLNPSEIVKLPRSQIADIALTRET